MSPRVTLGVGTLGAREACLADVVGRGYTIDGCPHVEGSLSRNRSGSSEGGRGLFWGYPLCRFVPFADDACYGSRSLPAPYKRGLSGVKQHQDAATFFNGPHFGFLRAGTHPYPPPAGPKGRERGAQMGARGRIVPRVRWSLYEAVTTVPRLGWLESCALAVLRRGTAVGGCTTKCGHCGGFPPLRGIGDSWMSRQERTGSDTRVRFLVHDARGALCS